MKQMTIYDISCEAGVSIATVSRVLNGSSKVSPKTRAKVLAVMEEFGYEPNVFARGLGSGSMKTIGILCADVSDIYLANAVAYLERELSQEGFDSLLSCTGHDYDDKVKCMRMIESRKVDAVIMVGSHYIEDTPKKNEYILETAQRIPVMLLNGYLEGENIYGALSDDYGAFFQATEQLIEKGCRRIGFLFREETYSCKQKRAGYTDAMKKHGMPLEEEYYINARNRIQTIKDELQEHFAGKEMVDGLIACDDELAIGAMKFFQEHSIQVPEQVAIVGCNNSVLSICCEPELTSVDNMCEVVCSNVVNMLMRVLDRKKTASKVVIGCKYVERGTTRKERKECQ